MGITISPLSDAIGARVEGLDLAQPILPEAAAMLRTAFNEYALIVVPGQDLTPETLASSMHWLGEVSRRNRPDEKRVESDPYISKVSNIRENGELIGSLPDGEIHFHSDAAYVEVPQKATFLYGVEIPSIGGNTRFSNLYRAFDMIPQQLRNRLEGRTALQVYDYTTTEKPNIEDGLDKIKHASHPIFLTHPETGRRSLYVSRLMTAKINELPKAESDEILEELFSYVEHPSNIYEHVWSPGDFVTWDNLCSAHARTDFPATERRLLLRGVIKGIHRPSA
jgi:taurine dioxygenase